MGIFDPLQIRIDTLQPMKLGTEVGLGPGHIVLSGDAAPHPKMGTAPNFLPMSVVAKRLDELR